jgi:hypothetical protein
MGDLNLTRRLTDAQKRALDWLPADGSWRVTEGRIHGALQSLGREWPDRVECEWAPKLRWRLTEKGIGSWKEEPGLDEPQKADSLHDSDMLRSA